MSSNEKFTADQFKSLLGPPRLIRGESEEAYWQWWSALAESFNPESFPDWLLVNDYATKSWEQRRLQRSNAVLVEEAFMKALDNLLVHTHSGRNMGLAVAERAGLVEDYFFGNEKERRRVAEDLQGWNITDDQIAAEAMRLRADSLIMFDKLDNQRANAKRALLKDLDRRMEVRRKSMGSTDVQA